MTPLVPMRKPYRRLSPRTARALSVISMGGLWGWFLLKFFLPSATGISEVLVGALAIIAVLSVIPLMLSTYAFRANAPAGAIDERELEERNRAYFVTVMYAASIALTGFLAVEVLSRAPAPTDSGLALNVPASISIGVVSNFLLVLFLTILACPTVILAWWDREEPGQE